MITVQNHPGVCEKRIEDFLLNVSRAENVNYVYK